MTEQLIAFGAYPFCWSIQRISHFQIACAACFGCGLQAGVVRACTQHLSGVSWLSEGDSSRLWVVPATW